MPPKGVVVASPTPPPMPANDVHDLLVIADMVDTFDQLPAEITRVHSDLNELSAVLYSTLVTLENKLNTLVTWIQDDSISPAQRFHLLQEIAEEAARYKLGGDDKIRVAAGACDGLVHHQRHINNLLQSSTLLTSAPPSPYTQALTLANPQPLTNTRRGVLARAANSPFGGRGYAAASGSGETAKDKDTPSKKKKSRVAQLGVKDDDEVSIGGKKPTTKKKKNVNRAVSPTDSLASASAFTGKPTEPRTARQLAAAANRAARKVEDAESDGDDTDSGNQPNASNDSIDGKGGLELALGTTPGHSRESTSGGKTSATNATAGGAKGNGRGRVGGSQKRSRDDDEDDGEDDDADNKPRKPYKKHLIGVQANTNLPHPLDPDGDLDIDQDAIPYCICQGPSYGEMIGCDNDNCEIEWFHISCLGLTKPPEGNWNCPACTEKLAKNPNKKRTSRAKARK